MQHAASFFDVIEACYRVDLDEGAWLANIAGVASKVLAGELGLAALVYSKDHAGIVERMHFGGGCDPRWAERFLGRIYDEHIANDDEGGDRLARASAHVHAACVAVRSACSTFSAAPNLAPFARTVAEWGGARDMLLVQGFDPSGAGVWLGIPRKRRFAPSRTLVERCGRVATHLAVGLRARARVAGKLPVAMADAVSSPDGRLLHAGAAASVTEARAALRRAVIALERARSHRSDDDDAAARTGLVDARWTLLDQFESDGRRLVVAVQNDADVIAVRSLSKRECQVLAHAALGHHTKQIAYDLGLAHATVRVLFHHAAKKLGVATRREALERFEKVRSRLMSGQPVGSTVAEDRGRCA